MRRFRWTPERRRVVDLLARGWSHVAIASHLAMHRNTVRNLLQHEEVKRRLAERRLAFVASTNLRRLHQISAMVVRTDAIVNRQFTEIERNGDRDPRQRKALLTALKERRALARAERKELAAIESACQAMRTD